MPVFEQGGSSKNVLLQLFYIIPHLTLGSGTVYDLHYRQFRDVLKSMPGVKNGVMMTGTLFDFIVDFYVLLYHQTFA